MQSQFALDPFSKSVFLFCSGKSDRFKALYWDSEGFWLLYKRIVNLAKKYYGSSGFNA
ncbi:IS66 family insertion sequence element accessory protein TnpB [Enterococcus cecorum]|uniref:IS66 family insertion sequence element accessory protein TnpB n=1 Tax=Enterococcus cecorum TaxID=44008 RepID=UPI003264A1F9